jgi:hypothetical protein
MARLTDEDLEQLLRETFADKEELVDSLPQATKRRRPVGPVLVAAAAALVVLGSILYGVNRDGDADPAPPVATGVQNTSGDASPDADIWAAVIVAMAQRFKPGDQVYLESGATAVVVRQYSQGRAAARFSEADKVRIEQLVAAVVPVRWKSPVDSNCTPQTLVISLGAVYERGDHKQVNAFVDNCNSVVALTYRVDKKDGVWTATSETAAPVGCPLSRTTPASPRQGC